MTDPLPDDLPPLHPALAPLAFLVGTWRGAGVGGYPTIAEDFRFGQEVVVGHVGRPQLSWTSRTWSLDDNGTVGRPLAAEAGWWRMSADDPTRVELVLAHPTGVVEVYVGTVTGTKVELATDVVARTETAKEVTAERRLYGLVEGGDLAYAVDLAAVGLPLTPHLSARLKRAP